MTDDPALQPNVSAEYLALADIMSSLPETSWDLPSLCAGWRVREVVAHMTMASRYDQESFMRELEARNGDFQSLSNDLAAQDANLSTETLLGDLRSPILHHWTPRGSYHDALNHAVIHGLDVTVPLQIQRRPPDETLRVVLDDLTEGGVAHHFGTVISGRRLEATDLPWSYGSGSVLRGTAADLALTLCGRRVGPGQLEGQPL